MSDFLELARQFGPLSAAVLFFLWQGWRRENRMQKRIDSLEKEHKNVILPIVTDCSKVIAENTAVMSRLEKILEGHHQVAREALNRVMRREVSEES